MQGAVTARFALSEVLCRRAAAICAAMLLLLPVQASAQNVVDDWSRIKPTCKSVNRFLEKYPDDDANPFAKGARDLRTELKCKETVVKPPRDTRKDEKLAENKATESKPGARTKDRPHNPPKPREERKRPRDSQKADAGDRTGTKPKQAPAVQYLPVATNAQLAREAFARKDYRTALDRFADSCNKEADARSCEQAAWLLVDAKKYALGNANYPVARTYFERTCDLLREEASCDNARVVNSWQEYGGGKVDPGRAYAYFLRSGKAIGKLDCAGQYATTCEVLGRGFLQAGRDYATTTSVFTLACNGGDARGCLQAGIYTSQGLGRAPGIQDHLRSEDLLRRGCEAKLAEACDKAMVLRASAIYGIVEPALARRYFSTSSKNANTVDCRTPANDVCYNLGLAYSRPQYGLVVQYTADTLFGRACDADHAVSCRLVGIKLLNARSHAAAAEKFVKGCTGNDGESCLSASKLYAWSAFPGYDRYRAQTLARRACDLKIAAACPMRY